MYAYVYACMYMYVYLYECMFCNVLYVCMYVCMYKRKRKYHSVLNKGRYVMYKIWNEHCADSNLGWDRTLHLWLNQYSYANHHHHPACLILFFAS